MFPRFALEFQRFSCWFLSLVHISFVEKIYMLAYIKDNYKQQNISAAAKSGQETTKHIHSKSS